MSYFTVTSGRANPTYRVKGVNLMEDNQIIEHLFRRDETALKEIEHQYGVKLKRLALQFLGNEADADECLNDVYFKTWNAIPPERPEHLLAYLMKICRYTAFGMIDRKNTQKRNAVLVELTSEMEQCIPDNSANPQQEELTEAINAFLSELSKETRMIFVRRYWYGDNIAQLAELFHCREGRIKTVLFRTRKKLAKFLKERGLFHEKQ